MAFGRSFAFGGTTKGEAASTWLERVVGCVGEYWQHLKEAVSGHREPVAKEEQLHNVV